MRRNLIKSYTAIIGGGASSLILACALSKKLKDDKKILIFEKEDRVGRKLSITGNGRCNLSNIFAKKENYHGEDTKIIDILFEKYDPKTVLKFFNDIGLLTINEDDGRVYPRTRNSSSVINVLRAGISKSSIKEITGTKVKNIYNKDDKYIIETDREKYICEKVVIASGGISDYKGKYSKDSFEYLKSFNFKRVETTPSLCPVKIENDSILKNLHGIRTYGCASLYLKGRKIKSEFGEIQFTKNYLSGICIFNLSRYVNRENDCTIHLSLLPEYSKDELVKIIKNNKKNCKGDIESIFTGMFHKNISLEILKTCKVDPKKSADTLNEEKILKISETINDWVFKTKKRSDFEGAQVSAGGISTDEIDHHTFESKKYKNMYISGEALDIDGDCGGYNLQFAFASGLCIADNISAGE